MSTYLKFGIHILHFTPLILAEFPLTHIHCKAEALFEKRSVIRSRSDILWINFMPNCSASYQDAKNNLESRPSRSVILQRSKNVLISIVLNDVCYLTLFTQLNRTYPRVGLL